MTTCKEGGLSNSIKLYKDHGYGPLRWEVAVLSDSIKTTVMAHLRWEVVTYTLITNTHAHMLSRII